MRVWAVDRVQIVITNKKSILQAEAALTSYASAKEGTIGQDIVSGTAQAGLQVHFFNKVKEEIPSSVLVKQGVTDIEACYRAGQVVRCFVLQRISPEVKASKSI